MRVFKKMIFSSPDLRSNHFVYFLILFFFQTIPPEFRDQVDLLVYQAYIAQKKFNVVINEIPESHELPEFRLVLLLAKPQSEALTK